MNSAVLRVGEDFRRKLDDYLVGWLPSFSSPFQVSDSGFQIDETDRTNHLDIVHHERGMRIRLTINSPQFTNFLGFSYMHPRTLTIECHELRIFEWSFGFGQIPSHSILSWLICFLLDPEWTRMEFRVRSVLDIRVIPDIPYYYHGPDERIESMDSFVEWMKEVSYHDSIFVRMLDIGCISEDSDQLSRYYVHYIKFFLYLEKTDIVYQHTSYLLSHDDDKRLSLLIPMLDPYQTLEWFSENDMESVPKLIEQLNQYASYEDLEL